MSLTPYHQTLYSIVNHILIQHPELRRPISELCGPSDARDWSHDLAKFLSSKYDETICSFVRLLLRQDSENVKRLLQYAGRARGQLCQDLFVLAQMGFKRNGYFVEFGAASGIEHSNTYLLEVDFGWNGILAEPGKQWHTQLKEARRCAIHTDCVWSLSGETLSFNEVGELSTLSDYISSDHHFEARKDAKTYDVLTVSLLDLLQIHDAPAEIDYMSIDTEGTEYEILNAFDFSQYRIKIITCEHNFTPSREKIYDMLTLAGYQRVFEDISWFDDWYILKA